MGNLNKTIKLGMPILATCLILTGCSNYNSNINNSNNTEIVDDFIDEPKVFDLSINFFGDLLIHDTVYNAALKNGTYDFTGHFEDIKEDVKRADYTCGNLEVPLGYSNFSNYPSFKAPSQLATAMKEVLDVELLSTSTNHSLDKGFSGLAETLDILDSVSIKHIGTARTQEEADNILIENINGANIAFIAYTYGTNGYPIPSNAPYSINLIDKEKIVSDANKAKEFGADFIIAKIHWGAEYQNEENLEQKELAQYLFENTDINLIVGDHPHVVQNIEKVSVLKDNTEKTGTVIYSLGNFISDQRDTYKNSGIICLANIHVDRDNPSNTKVTSLEYTPIYVDRNPGSYDKKYRVVNINKAIYDYENGLDSLISAQEYNNMIFARDFYRSKLLKNDFITES